MSGAAILVSAVRAAAIPVGRWVAGSLSLKSYAGERGMATRSNPKEDGVTRLGGGLTPGGENGSGSSLLRRECPDQGGENPRRLSFDGPPAARAAASSGCCELSALQRRVVSYRGPDTWLIVMGTTQHTANIRLSGRTCITRLDFARAHSCRR